MEVATTSMARYIPKTAWLDSDIRLVKILLSNLIVSYCGIIFGFDRLKL